MAVHQTQTGIMVLMKIQRVMPWRKMQLAMPEIKDTQ